MEIACESTFRDKGIWSIDNVKLLNNMTRRRGEKDSRYDGCIVLVGSRYGFERDFTIELK